MTKRGPKMDPYGTPELTLQEGEAEPSSATN